MRALDMRSFCALVAVAGAVACNSKSRSDQSTTPVSAEPAVAEGTSATSDSEMPSAAGEGETVRAEAELTAAEGAKIEGRASLVQEADGVRVVLEVDDAPPGKKGVHVHVRGDCSDVEGQSMGPHFAPKLQEHGLPEEDARHLGDLGNIIVEEGGRGRLEIKVPGATLGPDDASSFLGRALVVHAGEDVGSTEQPSGDSGKPMACGVIQKVTS